MILLSDSGGWDGEAASRAGQLAGAGALVIGIDLPQFQQALNGDGGNCVYPDGDLDNLSRFVQAYRHLDGYRPPILAGLGAGATLARDTLNQAPAGMFSAGLGLAPVAAVGLKKSLCAPATQAPSGAWLTIPATPDEAWIAAFRTQADRNQPAASTSLPAGLKDLPLIEVAATPAASAAESFAVMLSGDGGWAGIDKDIAAALAGEGIPVVGLDSLRYFWTRRTPESTAADLERIIGHYTTAWHRPRVLLIGYSQGADVLPFAVNRLSATARSHVALTAVLGLSPHALFEFHVGNWLGDDNSGPATLPEMNRISGMPVLCIYGTDESDSLCPTLDPHRFVLIGIKGGHHFDGDYAALARRILSAAGAP